MNMSPRLEIRDTGEKLYFLGLGEWIIIHKEMLNIEKIFRTYFIINKKEIKEVVLDFKELTNIDISCAWIIEQFKGQIESKKIKYQFIQNTQLTNILEQITPYIQISKQKLKPHPKKSIWDRLHESLQKFHLGIIFLGELAISLIRTLRHPSKLKLTSLVAHINSCGLSAIPIVALISFLIGVVLTFQSSFQLSKYGAEMYTVDLLAITLFREIAILLTAIMVAGRSASAISAQIGSMVLNQEIEALRAFRLSMMEVLIVPRIIALMISLPLLSFVSDIMGLLGGMIISYGTLDITPTQFTQQLIQSFQPQNFWLGLLKSPFFGFCIGFIGGFEGMQVKNSAMSLGEKTTQSVVESIFLVIILDALFSIIFTSLGI